MFHSISFYIQVPNDLKTLEDWYKQDTNAVPDVYILQPISSILKNFNNKVMIIPEILLRYDLIDKIV